MPKLQSFRLFVNERLTAAAVEIFGAVEKTVYEYHEENERLRRLLHITPERRLSIVDSLQTSLKRSGSTVFEEELQFCEQEWVPSLGEEDPEITQIKEEQEELQTSQEEEQFQGNFGMEDSIFTSPCLKSECDPEDSHLSLTLPQTQTVELRLSDSRTVDLQTFHTVTHSKGLDIPCDSPVNQYNVSCHRSASSNPVGLGSSASFDPSITRTTLYRCPDTGKTFAVRADLQTHLNYAKAADSECTFCQKQYNSPRELKAHVQNCHAEKLYTCPLCGKTVKRKMCLSRHMRIHTGEKPFSCSECGKSFSQRQNLSMHKLTHTEEKQFSCGYCKTIFYNKGDLSNHILIHIGDKSFICAECGKSFRTNSQLTRHKLTHSGEKPFSCGDCGKSFSLKQNLAMHKMTHTGEKPFSCGECGKSFSQKWSLIYHVQTHKRVKLFTCDDCGKGFSQKASFSRHKLTHTVKQHV